MIERMKICIKIIIRMVALTVFSVFPIKKNKVVFSNYFGKGGYGCNPKYIAEALINSGCDLDLVWITDNCNDELPPDIRCVRNMSFRSFYELCTARIWVDNQRKKLYVPKRKGQFYIQTWHGGIALKKIEMDAIQSYDEKLSYRIERFHDNRMIDIFISNSTFCTNMYRNAFLYTGDILECGYPRNDILVQNSDNLYREKIRRQFNISLDTKIVLYAPTFRSSKRIDAYQIDYTKVLAELENSLKEEWVFLIRLHPNVASSAKEIRYSKNIINASKYGDIQELMVAADMLITDYSNIMFEFSYMMKPCFLYTTDLDEYEKERDFYIDYNSLPFLKAMTTDELCKNIKQFDGDKYKDELTEFMIQFGIKETGNASETVAELILAKV